MCKESQLLMKMLRAVIALLIPLVSCQQQCFSPKDTGDSSCGANGAQQFYFDTHTSKCQPFYYKGCNGNENRFSSRNECEETCSNASQDEETVTQGTAAVCSSGAYPAGATLHEVVSCSNCPNGYECEGTVCCPTKEYLCNLDYDAGRFGKVGKHTPRYFYNKSYNNCMLFTFYGMAGNPNNFATYNECMKFCS